MIKYIIKRLLLIIPTLIGIMTVNFFIIQSAPGGPVERLIAQLQGTAVESTRRITHSGEGEVSKSVQESYNDSETSKYRGSQGLDPDLIKDIEKLYGFDKPVIQRYFIMMKNYFSFNFGTSYFRDRKVFDLIKEKLPVSISLGLWTTLLVYLISIPLGIKKALNDGSRFDLWSSFTVTIGYAIPGFLFAILLVILFAGGSFIKIFPLRGLVSEDWQLMSLPMKIADYFWHLVLPITAMVIGGFAGLTMFTKNSFIAEISKQYVITAKAKGLTNRRILYGHVFRNAMLIIIAGFPAAFISILFTGSVLIEVIFSLDGLGLLGFEAALNRDYAVIFATMYVFSMLGLVLNLVGDLMYMFIDPRIDFESREVCR
jgi:microcin C transport system permease protein